MVFFIFHFLYVNYNARSIFYLINLQCKLYLEYYSDQNTKIYL